ncbi:hypothetical protein EDC14_10328 [Hydrogenispora ethanolica]|uniref:Uncharacterized protein n=1 Tax=Hydrogenispora ethanolica TaxID=1082276 RepID=A0A4R1R801_HYDET|nr:hypothetical protein [Hydrogenispora ethanolica]TCL61775.1 hypothetical protein EDC14_10328 [Hydrogenispora ethanolica]
MGRKSWFWGILLCGLIIGSAASGKASDFRGNRWGGSMKQVAQQERAELEFRDDQSLFYRTRVAGLNCYLIYQFDRNQLYQAGYIIPPRNRNLNGCFQDYQKLLRYLVADYGEPQENQALWSDNALRDQPEKYGMAVSLGHLARQAIWYTPGTVIRLRLWGENRQINLGAGFFRRTQEETHPHSKTVFFGI